MEFSPAFLEQTHPKFVFIWTSKSKLRRSINNWQKVINDYQSLKPSDIEGKLVYTRIINGFSFYQGIYTIRRLGHRA